MKRNDPTGNQDMRLLTKAEASREPSMSLPTLNRRVAAREVPVKLEPRGRRHRMYVMLVGNPPGNGDEVDSGGTALALPGSGYTA